MTDYEKFVKRMGSFDSEISLEDVKPKKYTASELQEGEIEELLQHFGVKGMRWGVRRAKAKEARRTKREDKEYASPQTQAAVWVGIHNEAANLANKYDVGRINNKKEYKGINFNDPKNAALTKKYYKDHQDAFLKRVEEASKRIEPNASGTQTYVLTIDDNGNWGVTLSDIVKHNNEVIFTVKVKYDSMGRIVTILPSEQDLTMTDLTEDLLIHFGVKGMRWGVRKERANTMSDADLARKTARAGAIKAMKAAKKDPNLTRASRKVAKTMYKDRKNVKTADMQKKLDRFRKERVYSKTVNGDKNIRNAIIKNIAVGAVGGAMARSGQFTKSELATGIFLLNAVANKGTMETSREYRNLNPKLGVKLKPERP